MPLSEHEQRMLDQIEQALYTEDPKFANTVRQTTPAVHYKRWAVKASIGFFVGIAILMGGLLVPTVAVKVTVSVIGFLIMLSCAVWGLSAWRRMSGGAETTTAAEPKQRQQRRKQHPGMMSRLEERWRRRQEGDH